MNIIELPYDIIVHIASMMTINDMAKLQRTCSEFICVGDNVYIWRKAYELQFGAYGELDKYKNNKNNKNNENYGKNENNENDITWKEKYRIKRKERLGDVKIFNTNPTVLPGLDLLRGTTAFESYAISFLQDSCITRVSRGVYLSFADKRTLGLLDAYFDTLDFNGLSVLDSLMKMFSYIQFPSHFSVITRFMLCFAQRYYTCNTGSIFKNTDAVYVLAFGIIMLNTDIHNSAVKNKMTLAQYILNSSGINDGENLPENMLSDIYNNIKEKPLVLNRLTPAYESSLWSWVSDWISKLKT